MPDVKRPDFIDAQEKHRQHPDTFWVPSAEDLLGIEPGWLVKVAIGGEKFWVEIVKVQEASLVGRVDNNLISTDVHGLVYGEEVRLESRHVMDFEIKPGTTFH